LHTGTGRTSSKFLTKHHGPIYALAARVLFAWHYAVKGIFRSARLVIAPKAQREALAAWYHVRYGLRPHNGG
jgi:hypothetical protein